MSSDAPAPALCYLPDLWRMHSPTKRAARAGSLGSAVLNVERIRWERFKGSFVGAAWARLEPKLRCAAPEQLALLMTNIVLDRAFVCIKSAEERDPVLGQAAMVGKLMMFLTVGKRDPLLRVMLCAKSPVLSGLAKALTRQTQNSDGTAVGMMPVLSLSCGKGGALEIKDSDSVVSVSDSLLIDFEEIGVKNATDMLYIHALVETDVHGALRMEMLSLREVYMRVKAAFWPLFAAKESATLSHMRDRLDDMPLNFPYPVTDRYSRASCLDAERLSPIVNGEHFTPSFPLPGECEAAFGQYIADDDGTVAKMSCFDWPCFDCMALSARTVQDGVKISGSSLFTAFQENASKLRVATNVANPKEILVYGRSPSHAWQMKLFFFGVGKHHNLLRRKVSHCFGACCDAMDRSAQIEAIETGILHDAYSSGLLLDVAKDAVGCLRRIAAALSPLTDSGRERDAEARVVEQMRLCKNRVRALEMARSYGVAMYFRWCCDIVEKHILGSGDALAAGTFDIVRVNLTAPINRPAAVVERMPRFASLRLGDVVASALHPKCPVCDAPYVKISGCMQIHCTSCGSSFCHSCNRKYVDTAQPTTVTELIERAATSASTRRMTLPAALETIQANFALSSEWDMNFRAMRGAFNAQNADAGEDLRLDHIVCCLRSEALDDERNVCSPGSRPQPKHELIRRLESLCAPCSSKRFDHSLSNNKFISCPIYPDHYMKRSDSLLDRHNTIFASSFASLHERLGNLYTSPPDIDARVAGIDILIRVTRMLHVKKIDNHLIIDEGRRLAAMATAAWDERRFFKLVSEADGGLEALRNTLQFYATMESEAAPCSGK